MSTLTVVTQDELAKIYNIVEIALISNMTDVIVMINNNKWFELLDDTLKVTEFQSLIDLSMTTKYFEYVVKKFPKNMAKCSQDYKDLNIDLRIAKRRDQCYYYVNSKYKLESLVPLLYDGCIIEQNNRLYIVMNGDYQPLPCNNSGELYIPINVSKKFTNPGKFFSKIIKKDIVSCIHLCPYAHRNFIAPMLKVDHKQLYFLYKDKLTNFSDCFMF